MPEIDIDTQLLDRFVELLVFHRDGTTMSHEMLAAALLDSVKNIVGESQRKLWTLLEQTRTELSQARNRLDTVRETIDQLQERSVDVEPVSTV